MRGLIGKEVCIVTKQNKSIKQFVLIVLSFLMVFGNVAVANATANYDNEVAPLFVNISNHSEKFEISGIRAECKAKLHANNSVPLKIKMELQKEKSKGYETVETWTSSKKDIAFFAHTGARDGKTSSLKKQWGNYKIIYYIIISFTWG